MSNSLHESRQAYNQIRAETSSAESVNKDECNDITNKTLDDLEKLNQDFKKLASEEKATNAFLKQQLSSLTQDKMKLEQNVLLLSTRVVEVEVQVGIELTLPKIEGTHEYEDE
jgi:uncharacterized protein YlxW (UPF0749 family)